MATYKTPGVYVEEISTLPPSVAEVETAIPAFFGYTAKGDLNSPKRIKSLPEYEQLFGTAEPETGISIKVKDEMVLDISIVPDKKSRNVLYYALQLYFNNGGGPCYIVSLGSYKDSAAAAPDVYAQALLTIEKEDEPTLLVFPDAPYHLAPADYYSLMNSALMQCEKLGDRFAIIDVVDNPGPGTPVEKFRNAITNISEQKKYGAAYYPYLRTTLKYIYDEETLTIEVVDNDEKAKQIANAQAVVDDLRPKVAKAKAEAEKPKEDGDDNAKKKNANNAAGDLENQLNKAIQALADLTNQLKKQTFKDLSNKLQNQVKQKILELPLHLSPCAAVAGVYAGVDNARGVWKAPANVTLNFVTGPVVRITGDEQDDMNVDVNAGKSVNAIRAFAGKGTIIWGARTLAGNDNEWRYINVRRFFNMVEESVKKSTYWAVFEPNTVNTWVTVSAMIENYLILKWKEGALAGSTCKEAFIVRCGLGTTMTPADVLEGRMVIEIGMAVARPAEFIILKFSHKLQVS